MVDISAVFERAFKKGFLVYRNLMHYDNYPFTFTA